MSPVQSRFARCIVLLAAFRWYADGQSVFDTPAPVYQVRVESNIGVPMRDGVKLATDLYFPAGLAGKLPAVMIRTPYDKLRKASEARMFAGQGYVVVVQDVRGKFRSEGEFTVSANDTRDGVDLLHWISAQPWATGKIGTYGCSYLGEDQIELSKTRDPAQTAMIAQAAGGAYRYAGLVTGGVIELAMASGWFRSNGSKTNPPAKLPPADFASMWRELPSLSIVRNAGAPNTDWEGFVSHPPDDPWWDQFGYVNQSHRFNVPALHICSWNDSVVKDSLDLFNLLRTNADSERARENQFIIISPTTHCQSEQAKEHTRVGELDFGDARFDYTGLYVRWFDKWLKGVDNGVTGMPKVQLYVMGRNKWRGENEWPLARTKFTRYYLHSNSGANSTAGDGLLSIAAPGAEPADRFTYDPLNPVPTQGGALCCTGNSKTPEGPVDQREIERRNDVLVYTTPALTRGIEITGPLEAVLYVSSSAKDTDFTAKLVDVFPDGRAMNVQEGILRARYREGFAKRVWMKPQEVYRLTIDLAATSLYLGPGHRIRLEVSSSDFPRFERNLNTGGNNYDESKPVSALNKVHHSASWASYLILPIIPE